MHNNESCLVDFEVIIMQSALGFHQIKQFTYVIRNYGGLMHFAMPLIAICKGNALSSILRN
jgi:hypothetical protein